MLGCAYNQLSMYSLVRFHSEISCNSLCLAKSKKLKPDEINHSRVVHFKLKWLNE